MGACNEETRGATRRRCVKDGHAEQVVQVAAGQAAALSAPQLDQLQRKCRCTT